MNEVITAPAVYPVTLAEAKEWTHVESDDTSQDGTLAILIAGMTEYAEHVTGQAFVERTLQENLSYFPYCIELPWPPLLGIISVKYTDLDDTEQTVSSDDYEVDTVSKPGRVRPVWGESWPSLGHGFNPVRVRYLAGYRPTESPTDLTDNSYLPAKLRIWMQSHLATLFKYREQIIDGRDVKIPRNFADAYLDSLTIGSRLF